MGTGSRPARRRSRRSSWNGSRTATSRPRLGQRQADPTAARDRPAARPRPPTPHRRQSSCGSRGARRRGGAILNHYFVADPSESPQEGPQDADQAGSVSKRVGRVSAGAFDRPPKHPPKCVAGVGPLKGGPVIKRSTHLANQQAEVCARVNGGGPHAHAALWRVDDRRHPHRVGDPSTSTSSRRTGSARGTDSSASASRCASRCCAIPTIASGSRSGSSSTWITAATTSPSIWPSSSSTAAGCPPSSAGTAAHRPHWW